MMAMQQTNPTSRRALPASPSSSAGGARAAPVTRERSAMLCGAPSATSAARDVGHFAQQAAPVVAHIGAGALQGAMAGSAAGLPGIIAGAAVGGTGAGLSRYGSGTARQIGGALSGVTSMASQFSPAGR